MTPNPKQLDHPPPEPSFLAVLTLVIWLMALAVGLLGLWLTHAPPKSPPREPEPLKAELIDVAIDTQLTQTAADEPTDIAQPPTPLDSPPPPPAPPLPMVAAPSPAIAFALPVEGPVQIVPAARAPPAPPRAPAQQPTPQPPHAPSAPQRLTFGQGEGRQPAPQYPSAAVLEHQEGVVLIRFAVGPDGRVLNADVATPSRWPLLNQAALQAVRERWVFRPGPPRLYEVPIRFKLND